MLLLFSADFFQNILSGTQSDCQTIRSHTLLVLICVQTVYKGCQQIKKVSASEKRVKGKSSRKHICAKLLKASERCIFI